MLPQRRTASLRFVRHSSFPVHWESSPLNFVSAFHYRLVPSTFIEDHNMGRSKTFPQKRSSEANSSILGRQSLPADISIDAMMMIEVEQARIAQQHRTAMQSNIATPTPEERQRRPVRKKRKRQSVSFGSIRIIGPPELQMIHEDDSIVWKIHPEEEEQSHPEKLRIVRTIRCPSNIHLIPMRPYHFTSPQASVDVVSKVFPSLLEDQRRSFYHAVQQRHVIVSLDVLNDNELWLSIALTNKGWDLIRSREMTSRQKPLLHMKTLLVPLFPDLLDDNEKDEAMTAGHFYKLIDNQQLLQSKATTRPDTPIPGLKPTLRPYQRAAVDWMVRRERETIVGQEWMVAWVVLYRQSGKVELLSNCHFEEDVLYHCPFTGWFADSIESARRMTVPDVSPIRGGILAESMGLGKTVEVLACILSNPSPQHKATSEAVAQHIVLDGPNHGNIAEAEARNELKDFDDEMSIDGNVQPSTGQQAIRVVTPERKVRLPEVWSDDDVLGGCICGDIVCFSRTKELGDIVVCRSCNEPMHCECAYIRNDEERMFERVQFRQRFTNATIGGYYCPAEFCPSCMPEMKTKASLIVSPIAILNQWEREIQCHTELTTKEPLKVIVYEGIKQYSGDRSRSKFMHARYLNSADIVLVSFEAMRSDLGHVENSQASEAHLRRRKRYRITPSPLVSMLWWRVCLDEAQRVESTATGAAKVALSLKSINRWCVSGTPIGRGKLEDLYGLLLFMGLKPFDNILWFRRCIQRLSSSSDKRLMSLLQDVLWRSTKDLDSVRAQMNVPEQTENRVILKLSSIEKHFYNKQLERTLEIAGSLHGVLCGRRKAQAKMVSNQLHMLRAACCHPQVGSRGIASIRKRGVSDKDGVDARVMTMGQIRDKLIVDAKQQCEEAQRLAIMHTNAMAALPRLMVEARNRGIASSDSDRSLLEKSCDHYMESLRLAEDNATPTMVVGEIDVQGSVGFFRTDTSGTIQQGSTSLEWRNAAGTTTEHWASFNFSTEQRSISEIRFRQLRIRSENMMKDTSRDFNWHTPRVKMVELQNAGRSGEFIPTETLLVSHSQGQSGDWIIMKGFRSTKSKAWRLLFKTEGGEKKHTIAARTDGWFLRFEVELYEASVASDPLQRLHCLHNAALSFTALSKERERDTGNRSNDEDCRKLGQKSHDMNTAASFIERSYLDGARSKHKNAKFRFQLLHKQREEHETRQQSNKNEREQTDCWQSTWWEHFLVACHHKGPEKTKQVAFERLRQDLDGYIQGEINHLGGVGVPLPPFGDLNGFLIAIRMRLQSIRTGLGEKRNKPSLEEVSQTGISTGNSAWFHCPVGAHAICMRKMLSISDNPTASEIAENSTCMVCKADWNQTGPVCKYCKIRAELEGLEPDKVTLQAFRSIHGLVRGPLGRTVLSKNERARMSEQASWFFTILDMMDKERLAAQRFWRVHLDFMNDLDELRQCKTAMRLIFENENFAELSEDEQNGVVVPCDLRIKYDDHAAKQAMALGNLKRCKGTLSYLKNLIDTEKERLQSGNKREEAACMICLAPFDSDRAVLRCGHSVHVHGCLERLRARFSNGRSIACPLRCRVRSEPSKIFVASHQSHDDGTRKDETIRGSYGTKVSRLVSDIMKMRQRDEKGVVFSQWDDMIEIIASALKENSIPFILAAGASKIGSQVSKFRSSDCSVLLLNVKNGSEGLTLLEANHVFMVEPLLNTGLDRQGEHKTK